MDEKRPELDHGAGTPPPPEESDGDHRPDPDWMLVGFLAFTTSFAAFSAFRFGQLLVRVLR